MILTNKSLDRRTFLKGAGAVLALPWLDAMIPARASASLLAATRAKRLAIAYVPNGIIMERWTPATVGALELTPTLKPLAPFRDQLTLVSGLECKPAMPLPGEGTGDHVRAASAFLTGVHPKKTDGPDIRGGVSMDQLAAAVMGRETQLGSLELALDPNELIGACEAGWSCAYANTLSWRNSTTPLPMENQPRAVFERLFGDSDNTSQQARLARIAEDKSLLDALLEQVAALERTLGPGDRAKLTQYLDSIRDLERRIAKAEKQSAIELPPMERPTGGIPGTFIEHARLMFDMQVLAYQTDMTRVITFMMSREVSPRSYPEIGIADPHHGLSHHQNVPGQIEKLIKLNRYHIEQLAYFLEKLAATPDGEGTLLDNVMVLYGCGISDGNQHLHSNLPILLAGGGSGQLKGGRHVRVEEGTPLTNLHLALLEKCGVPTEKLGDSDGRVLSGI